MELSAHLKSFLRILMGHYS